VQGAAVTKPTNRSRQASVQFTTGMEGNQGRQIIRRISLLVLILSHASSGFDLSGFTGKNRLATSYTWYCYLHLPAFCASTEGSTWADPIMERQWLGKLTLQLEWSWRSSAKWGVHQLENGHWSKLLLGPRWLRVGQRTAYRDRDRLGSGSSRQPAAAKSKSNYGLLWQVIWYGLICW
jgi:hypothetical protein